MQQAQKRKIDDIRQSFEQKGYQPIKSIGKGAFGQVLLIKQKKTGKMYAAKAINRVQVRKKPFLQKYIEQQIQIMGKLSHKNIVHQKFTFKTTNFILIVMQFCEQGNLLSHQARLPGRIFPPQQALQILVEILKGLKYIHQLNYIHRDIKPENILISKVQKQDGTAEVQYKIADFGFARPINGMGAKTHCGTQRYMAPEIINNSCYGIGVDIWAVGVLFYFMLFGEFPFKGHDMKAQISRKCKPYFDINNSVSKKQKLRDIDKNIEDFFKKIFVVNPEKRMTFAEIATHQLFSNYAFQFSDNIDLYNKLKAKQLKVKDQMEQITEGEQSYCNMPQDEMRAQFLCKPNSKNVVIEKQLGQIQFQIKRVLYLKQCATELFQNYSNYLTYPERLAAQFYLLRAFLLYSESLLRSLQQKQMPFQMKQLQISVSKWSMCIQSSQYGQILSKLSENCLKVQSLFEDTYNALKDMLQNIKITNFDQQFNLNIKQQLFDDLKLPYRSTTSYIFKVIHNNKKIGSHLKNKIKMRLFCCHMINRIFTRSQLKNNFPYFYKWLDVKNIKYEHSFDFLYFEKWILEENEEKLSKNINLLHKLYF